MTPNFTVSQFRVIGQVHRNTEVEFQNPEVRHSFRGVARRGAASPLPRRLRGMLPKTRADRDRLVWPEARYAVRCPVPWVWPLQELKARRPGR